MSVSPSNLTETQEKVLSLLPILPALVSIVGSCTIIYIVTRNRRAGMSPDQRFLLALSCADILASASMATQAFAVPAQSSFRVWAVGTPATCSAVAALQQVGFASYFYNGALSTWYMMTVRYGYSQKDFARTVEPFLHILAGGYPLVTALAGLFMGVYHELDVDLGCWVSDFPHGCDSPGFEGTCRSVRIGWLFMAVPTIMLAIVVFVNMSLITTHVRRSGQSDVAVRHKERVKSVVTQAVCYFIAFCCSFVWYILLRLMEANDIATNDEASIFWLLLLNRIWFPSLGTLNVLVFLRPQYVRLRHKYPEQSRLWALQQSITQRASSGPSSLGPNSGHSDQRSRRRLASHDTAQSSTRRLGQLGSRDTLRISHQGHELGDESSEDDMALDMFDFAVDPRIVVVRDNNEDGMRSNAPTEKPKQQEQPTDHS
jgi:hypothetical protein